MNDMELLTRFREEIPAAGVSPRAERLFLAGIQREPARRALTGLGTVRRAAPGGRAFWAGRRAWRLAIAGGLSAALAATALGAMTLGHSSAPPASGTLTVTELAYRAAGAATRQPAVRPGQWVYRKYLMKDWSRPATTEFWTTADSRKAAWVSAGGKVHFFSGQASLGMTAVPYKKVHGEWYYFGFGPFPVTYAGLSSLPRSPMALDRYLGRLQPRNWGSNADREFQIISELLTAYVMPPGLTAELYRALGDIPGVTADTHATDVAGRPGIGFRLPLPDLGSGAAAEIIVSPRSYRLMADEFVLPQAPSSRSHALSIKGTAILQETLVSGPGVRP